MTATVLQLNASHGGLPKYEVAAAFAGPDGLEGDRHAHPQFHGGPDKALLLVSHEDLESLVHRGWEVFPGALGENITVSGLDFRQLRPGMRFRIGPAAIELTELRVPCRQLDVYNRPEAEGRIQEAVYDARCKSGDATSPRWAFAGFLARVLTPGLIRKGDPIRLLDASV